MSDWRHLWHFVFELESQHLFVNCAWFFMHGARGVVCQWID
jgi:hypothetical protein